MDLLASLNIDSLPEQQTRTCDPAVTSALSKNPEIQLGFNVCCNCACANVSVQCRGCKRVKYCSERCREEDANRTAGTLSSSSDENLVCNEDSIGFGHTSVICALLSLCDSDELVDSFGTGKLGVEGGNLDEDAKDRVRSEYESYPATLANVLLDGPCYQGIMSSFSSGQIPTKKELTIHVIGAAVDAELCGKVGAGQRVFSSYAEALSLLAEGKGIQKIHVIFIGPDCPKIAMKESHVINDESKSNDESTAMMCDLVFETCRENYSKDSLTKGSKSEGRAPPPSADIVIFFNPGFTCPDYEWNDALSCVMHGTPFLVTTNTLMEAIADCQYLFERNLITSLPQTVSEILALDEDTPEHSETGMFFGENPYAGSRVRQSGTMANDVFVKNRWMFGGVFSTASNCGLDSTNVTTKQMPTTRQADDIDGSDPIFGRRYQEFDSNRQRKKRKKRKAQGSGNSKKGNPALI